MQDNITTIDKHFVTPTGYSRDYFLGGNPRSSARIEFGYDFERLLQRHFFECDRFAEYRKVIRSFRIRNAEVLFPGNAGDPEAELAFTMGRQVGRRAEVVEWSFLSCNANSWELSMDIFLRGEFEDEECVCFRCITRIILASPVHEVLNPGYVERHFKERINEKLRKGKEGDLCDTEKQQIRDLWQLKVNFERGLQKRFGDIQSPRYQYFNLVPILCESGCMECRVQLYANAIALLLNDLRAIGSGPFFPAAGYQPVPRSNFITNGRYDWITRGRHSSLMPDILREVKEKKLPGVGKLRPVKRRRLNNPHFCEDHYDEFNVSSSKDLIDVDGSVCCEGAFTTINDDVESTNPNIEPFQYDINVHREEVNASYCMEICDIDRATGRCSTSEDSDPHGCDDDVDLREFVPSGNWPHLRHPPQEQWSWINRGEGSSSGSK